MPLPGVKEVKVLPTEEGKSATIVVEPKPENPNAPKVINPKPASQDNTPKDDANEEKKEGEQV